MTKRIRLPILTVLLVLALVAVSRADSWTTIDYPGAAATAVWGINERGDMVGFWIDSDFNSHGFLLERGRFTSLDVPNATFTQAADVSNRGVVHGRYFDANDM